MPQQSLYEETIKNVDYSNQPIENRGYECCTFINCNFSNCSLRGSQFMESDFIDCNLSNAELTGVSFQDVKFSICKMLGLHFDQCKPFGFSISFDKCQLNHSIFYQVKVGQSSFIDCQLQGIDFTEANLKNVALKNCDLLNAIFENTTLEKADFTHSINYSINPEVNKIKGAKFSLPEVIGLLDKYKIQIQ
jgi:uncharacterized protein YjbI with pentapeptide repeats